jgi:hypothetical protein
MRQVVAQSINFPIVSGVIDLWNKEIKNLKQPYLLSLKQRIGVA